jgi:hypothetical protein
MFNFESETKMTTKTTTKKTTSKTTTKKNETSTKTTTKKTTYFMNANEMNKSILNENDLKKRVALYAKFLKSSISIANNIITIEKHRENLLQLIRKNKHDSKMCKSLRHELRNVCLHDGALRNKKYTCRVLRQTIFAKR